MALFPGLPGWASTRKVKSIWILLKQETVSGSGISWDICKSACTLLQTDNHASTPPLCFLQAGCPSCRPTNSVKALKAQATKTQTKISNSKHHQCTSQSDTSKVSVSPLSMTVISSSVQTPCLRVERLKLKQKLTGYVA